MPERMSKHDQSTPDLFAAYLRQMEELGVEQLHWKPPEKVPRSEPPVQEERMGVRPKPQPKPADPERLKLLSELETRVSQCTQCRLHKGRTQTVFGQGNPSADLVLVGEAPGFEEDRQGIPFVGRAGQLLTKILQAMHLERDEVYICNIIKCRPPENRNPDADEIVSCEPYLIEQLRLIQPKVICAMGKFAAQTLLQSQTPISRLRGQWHHYQGIPLMPTFHPAYLLRNPGGKHQVWEDMQQIMARLGIPL